MTSNLVNLPLQFPQPLFQLSALERPQEHVDQHADRVGHLGVNRALEGAVDGGF
jgi:hypothetical protein